VTVPTDLELRLVPLLDLHGVTSEVRAEVLARWSAEVLDGSGFIGGETVATFESALARYCGTDHAVGLANGTDALQLALRAIGIGPGDDVIIPANTFVATAEAVVLAGARPRFADVDPATLLLTPETIEAALTPLTRAVIVVHLYGQMPDMAALEECASRLDIALVEDAAQAQGATWGGRKAGSFGVAGCFSFYPGKNLGAWGDAGAVVTSDPDLDQRLRSMRDHGRSDSHYLHVMLGTNSRLDALQAVVLTAKLARLDSWNRSRRELMAQYRALIDPAAAVPVAALEGGEAVHHLAVVRVRNRAEVQHELASLGIVTGIHYPTPCHLMAPYAACAHRPLPEAERAAEEVMSLPMFPHLQPDDVAYVAQKLNEVAARLGRP
jgi:dTDP-4-amino-4,6-dideoxygalactose transaminase